MADLTPRELPNPFLFADGTQVRSPQDWRRRRGEIADLIVGVEYGGLPPAPTETRAEALHTLAVEWLDGAMYHTYHVVTGPDRPVTFLLSVLVPPGDGPFPVVLNGDACWRYVTDRITTEVLRRGMILAQFNRCELAPDLYNSDRTTGIYLAYPEGAYGALSAWAWGYHRCVDVLASLPQVDAARIGIVGHSRGGKATLLAGATDERIAVTGANNSGAGGAGSYLWQGPESETLADSLRMIPYWFGPELAAYLGREAELPFDQHFLKALVAPRALLTCEAHGDPWANGTGTWRTHLAAREVYRFLGAEERLGLWFREGPHRHGWEDWVTFLDFMQWQLDGGPEPAGINEDPFPGLPPAFSWTAPH
jgi:hypothetical protein